MNKVLSGLIIKKCSYDNIKKFISDYYKENKIIVDSFWEGQVRESSFYNMEYEKNIIGYFAINNETVLTLFNVLNITEIFHRNCLKQ